MKRFVLTHMRFNLFNIKYFFDSRIVQTIVQKGLNGFVTSTGNCFSEFQNTENLTRMGDNLTKPYSRPNYTGCVNFGA